MNFPFPLNENLYTLYFIPDRTEFSDYVPTIYGKTLALDDNSFFNADYNMNVVFEILKSQSLPSGPGRIGGRITSDMTSGRTGAQNSYPVVLLSKTGTVVGLTYTDENGYFHFDNIPADEYAIFVPMELDKTVMTEPFPVDIVADNKTVNIQFTTEGITTEAVVTGLDDTDGQFYVHPIPTKNIVTIRSIRPINDVQLTDVTGRLQSGITRGGNQVNLSGVDAGVYLLKIYSGPSLKVFKIVKE